MKKSTPEATLIDGIVSSAINCGISVKEEFRNYYDADDALKMVEVMSDEIKIATLKVQLLQKEVRFAQGAFLAVVILCMIVLYMYIMR